MYDKEYIYYITNQSPLQGEFILIMQKRCSELSIIPLSGITEASFITMQANIPMDSIYQQLSNDNYDHTTKSEINPHKYAAAPCSQKADNLLLQNNYRFLQINQMHPRRLVLQHQNISAPDIHI